jgi:pectate lyase
MIRKLIGLSVALALVGSANAATSAACPDSLVGWATTGAGTTGGGSSAPVVVTTLSALKSALSGNTARVVHLSGTIDTGSSEVTIGSNKTLRGVDAKAKVVGGLAVRGNNVIVQNLTVQGKGLGKKPADALNASGSTNVWFDHLNILDGGDGLLDLTNASDRITVSWNKFSYTDPKHTHRLALLIGNSSEKCSVDAKKMNVTVHHNWFSTLVDQRMPRLLFGKGHIYNNYYNSPGNTYNIGAGSWASLLVENNYFKNVNNPHRFQDNHPAYIAVSGNIYDNVAGKRDTGLHGSDGPSNDCEKALPTPAPWTPSYSYTLDSASAIPDLVMACAGPR